ncbi:MULTISPECIES: flagellar hook-associated protein FlgL [Rahnella]|jgi:flagellar hook-associated protein 3 FlgL|uniref:Flagellar hook-associated protein 3 n=1 Tax=Rahnella variigena TaxID=574964 RepID=A0ABX9Q1T2_9GAMM|nr:flagellar hook-associated protein FlgL [Rahnella variigena]RJT50030.1 flagellar hook-associated protein 3 [Rahnella variigena]RKF70802.1 flagellar hook-associated protein 3 [Rahnella variigena]RYJ18910.1 flagellar hook-associated protein 3 [Rahnella variigena]
MRLSTQYMFQNNINSLSSSMNTANGISMRLSAGQRLLNPSDDPSGAAQAIMYQNSLANMKQFDSARGFAKDALNFEDNTLNSLGNILTKNLSEKIVAAGKGTMSDADRQAVATELQGIRDNMLDLGNAKNSNGRYVFAGYNTGTAPFEKDGTYIGGNTAMTQIVADSTEMQVGHTGSDVFMSGTPDDLLAQLDSAIAALNTPITDDAGREALQKTLDGVNVSIKKGIDNLGRIQAEVGTNLQQIDALNATSMVQQINVESSLQETVGSDYSTFITLVSQSKMAEFSLNASMMVFQTMQKMNIFNM